MHFASSVILSPTIKITSMNKLAIWLTVLGLLVSSTAIIIFATIRDESALQGNSNPGHVRRKRILGEKSVVENLRAIKSVMPLESKTNVCTKPIDEKITITLKARPMDLVDRKRAAQMASDKNQVMDELLNLPQIPSDYAETMIALFRDSTQDVVTRDFAVQHIGLYAQALNRRGQYDPKSAEAERCRAALFDSADETETIVAAAAFRALSDVSEFDSCISVSISSDPFELSE